MPVIVVIVAAATVAALVIVYAGGDDRRPARDSGVDAVAGRDRAARACGHLAEFLRVVERNGSADDANDALDALVADADAAAGHHPEWTQLASGAQALRLGIDEDDPEATALAIRLVRQGCEEAR